MKEAAPLIIGAGPVGLGAVLYLAQANIKTRIIEAAEKPVQESRALAGYRFSLEVVNEIAPENRRSEVVSSYLIACYCGISLPVIGIGLVSQASSAFVADMIFAMFISILAVLTLAFQLKISPENESLIAQNHRQFEFALSSRGRIWRFTKTP